ncbi:hypothetical protein E2562_012298 [Oryza meyeriana var. granulata]|uniref:Uncharacterized protein n=1 Tax=Oryza meyeriana var. granulata TaxID=110450 RepID=A0A6G1DHA0_9ORYZ|nr:hypothetical protein E2562_012298 [Oryza meyeriana var. granulata]
MTLTRKPQGRRKSHAPLPPCALPPPASISSCGFLPADLGINEEEGGCVGRGIVNEDAQGVAANY